MNHSELERSASLLSSLNKTRVRDIAVSKAVLNRELVLPRGRPVVGSGAGRPSSVVQGTVLPHNIAILDQLVGVEELARLSLAAVRRRRSKVGNRLGSARLRAALDVERRVGPDLEAHVSIALVAIGQSIDGRIAKVGGVSVASRGGDLVADVAVRAGDGDLEARSPLTIVVGIGFVDGSRPKDTLDVGSTWGIGAGVHVWVDGWVALEIDVEGKTIFDRIALGCADTSIISVKKLVA